MNIQEFASKNRLKITFPSSKRIAPDTEPVVEGKCGMIGDGFPGEGPFLLLHLLAVPRNANMDSKLTRRGKAAQEAGMRLKVRSGPESVWYFDPADATQARAAIALVQAKRRRTVNLTDEQRAALAQRLAAARQKASLEAQSLAGRASI